MLLPDPVNAEIEDTLITTDWPDAFNNGMWCRIIENGPPALR